MSPFKGEWEFHAEKSERFTRDGCAPCRRATCGGGAEQRRGGERRRIRPLRRLLGRDERLGDSGGPVELTGAGELPTVRAERARPVQGGNDVRRAADTGWLGRRR